MCLYPILLKRRLLTSAKKASGKAAFAAIIENETLRFLHYRLNDHKRSATIACFQLLAPLMNNINHSDTPCIRFLLCPFEDRMPQNLRAHRLQDYTPQFAWTKDMLSRSAFHASRYHRAWMILFQIPAH